MDDLVSGDGAETSIEIDEADESTEYKLALLASKFPERSPEVHLDYLLAYDGNLARAVHALNGGSVSTKRKRATANGYQSSLRGFITQANNGTTGPSAKRLTQKGKTLHLYSPLDIEENTPCSIIHNFLPSAEADALLRELLQEVPSFHKDRFQLFDRTVESPHTSRFYVDNWDDVVEQRTEYLYNGGYVDVAQTTPEMLRVSGVVREKTNNEIKRRIREYCPGGKKLKFQSDPRVTPWKPNASFVNCYDGGAESVGYHSDQLTYLGVLPTIASLSLGVSRQFRLKKIAPDDDEDELGQIAIHLPHNSLLIMHAECQEKWKHAVAPARSIDPHPVAKNKRLNITYRHYLDFLHPKHTPRCKCGTATVLRCVQKQAATRGRYVWMCHVNYVPGQAGCSFFQWAEFDEDGRPPWAEGYEGDANQPARLRHAPSSSSGVASRAKDERA